MVASAGIDLASSPEYGARRYNRVGLAALAPDLRVVELRAGRLTDGEILDFVARVKVDVVAIDAPLSLPSEGASRSVDRAMARLGFRPYPPLIPSMKPLTLRGVALKARLQELGVPAIEVFPGAVQDVLGLPRKQAGLARLLAGLRRLGIRGLEGVKPDRDLLDAVTAAHTAHMYREGRFWMISAPGEERLVFPALRRA